MRKEFNFSSDPSESLKDSKILDSSNFEVKKFCQAIFLLFERTKKLLKVLSYNTFLLKLSATKPISDLILKLALLI
jgi:hypothetical protein